MTLTDRIIEACNCTGGLTTTEIALAVEDTRGTVSTIAGNLYQDGRLKRAGVKCYYRYFVRQEDADAWDLVALDVYKKMMAESKERKRLAKNERQRKREKQMTLDGTRPSKAKKRARLKQRDLLIKKAKRSRGQQENRVSITVASSGGSIFKPDAVVVWPDHVKVQVIPTPVDTRYRFIPPSNDWKGEISRDWMNRRLEGAQA
jgi:hypothetical protein